MTITMLRECYHWNLVLDGVLEVIKGLMKEGINLSFETKSEKNRFMFVQSYWVMSLANMSIM